MPARDASSFHNQVVKIETAPASSTRPEVEQQSSYEGYLYPGDVLYIPKGMFFQTKSRKQHDDVFEPSISFHVTVALDEPDVMTAKKLNDTDVDRNPIAPDNHSSSNGATCNVVPEPQTGSPRRDRDYNIALSRNRTLLIKQTERSSPDGTNFGKRKGKRKESKAGPASSLFPGFNVNYLDSVIGPTAALRVSFQTEIRASTKSEKKHSQNLLLNTSSSRSNEKNGTGLRRELRDVANLLSTRVRLFAPGGGRASPSISSARVVDICELVKRTLEDRPEYFLVCDLTLLAFVKREVEAGNLTIVDN